MGKGGEDDGRGGGGDADSDQPSRSTARRPDAPHAGPQVRLAHCLGFASGASSGGALPVQRRVEHVSNDEIVYLSGKHVAIFSYEAQQHRFITKQQKTATIIAFAVSANRRYIALAEQLQEEKLGNGGSTEVSVWNLGVPGSPDPSPAKKVRVLSFAYLSKQPVVTLGFSRDNKYLATATMHPEAYVHLWQLDKNPPKPLGMSEVLMNTKVNQITISPWNSETLCTTGTSTTTNQHFKFWKFCAPNQLKPTAPMAKQREYRYTCHTWFDEDRVVVGTMEGDILVVENMELKKVIPAVHAENLPIWCTAWTVRGFVCAGDGGYLSLFERTYDQDYFQLSTTRSFQTPEKLRIVDISVSPNEENVICSYDNNQITQFNLANIDIIEPDKDTKENSIFKPLTVGFHSETVTGVDVCIQKSIIVTSSIDRRVRVWNYVRKRVEIDKQFEEEVNCVSVHPTGLRLVVGFKYKIAMYNVLATDLHFCQDFPVKHCKEVQFSQGGQFFAAAVVTKIYVFNSYNFNCIASLAGHQSMVKSICWTQHDQYIISAGFEGAIYEWRVETMSKTSKESTQKAIAYSCARFDDDHQMVVAVGSNKMTESGLQEGSVSLRTLRLGLPDEEPTKEKKELAKPIEDPLLLGTVRQKPAHTRTHTAECAISSVHKALFVGTSDGYIRWHRWPLRERDVPISQMAVHEGEVLFVLLSSDERYLFSIGEDRCLFMFEVETFLDERLRGTADAEKRCKSFNFSTFEDVAYVLQQELDDKSRQVLELTEENDQLERRQQQDREKTIAKHKYEQQSRQEELQRQLHGLQDEVAQAQQEREDIRNNVAQKQEMQMRQHRSGADKLEQHYKERTEEMRRREQQLKDEKDDMIVRYDNMISIEEKQANDEKNRLTLELQRFKECMQADIEELKKEREEQKQKQEDLLDSCEEQFEDEVKELLEGFREDDAKKDGEIEKEKAKNAHKLKRMEAQHQINKAKQKNKEEEEGLVSKLKQKNKEHEKTNDALRLEISVRNDNIVASEKKIGDLKKQTAELEKLKYVLFFKFNELRKEVNPKEEQIAVMDERMCEMQQELHKIAEDREMLRQGLGGKNDKIRVIVKESESRQRILAAKERLIRNLLKELSELLRNPETQNLVYELRDKVATYARKYDSEHGTEGKATVHEFHRQRTHMEKRLSSAEKQNVRRQENLQKDNQRKTTENALLVREINDLRHEKKVIMDKLQHAEKQVQEARATLSRAQGQQQAPGVTPVPHARAANVPSADAASSHSTAGVQRPATAGTGAAASRRALPSTKLREIASMDPVRIANVVRQVERNNAEMLRQQEEIKRLRGFAAHLLSRAEMDGALTPEQQSENARIRAELSLPTPPKGWDAGAPGAAAAAGAARAPQLPLVPGSAPPPG